MTDIIKTRTQTRGHCQICGRIHAVDGTMAKHGYTVRHGWFEGVCTGNHFKPLEQDRGALDAAVATITKQVADLRVQLAGIDAGTVHPTKIVKKSGRSIVSETPWAEAGVFERETALRHLRYDVDSRIRIGERVCRDLLALAERVHGQPLQEVEVVTARAPITLGEKRVSNGHTLTVVELYRARVYWKDERGMRSWTGSAAWRKLPLA